MTPPWTRLADVADCPPGTCLEAIAGERVVALFNVAGQFYALDGVCPHQGGPLGQGALKGQTVTCPWHGWQFDVRNGQCRLSPSVVQPTIPVRIEQGVVYVQV
ncbi:MAG: Rieske 2Fe-2S domain-containing protein [Planctomycetales bacterium]|nr:Rieske 2Fe-2S domain-containing protein [Planctomycetales bacterium]